MTPVWEDPDELGYWSGSFTDRGGRKPESLARCNEMLSDQEQRVIQECAYLMGNGHDFDAERNRAFAGYDFTYRKADRIQRGLPTGRLGV